MLNFQNELQGLGIDPYQVGVLAPMNPQLQDVRLHGGHCGGCGGGGRCGGGFHCGGCGGFHHCGGCGGFRCGGCGGCGGFRCGGFRCSGFNCFNCVGVVVI